MKAGAGDAGTGWIDPALLAILVCPLTRTPLRWDARASELVSEAARLAFPVCDGVPNMIVDQARSLDAPLTE